MKDKKLKLPVGIENFEKLRKESFYYVDKTNFIIDLLNNWGEVNLFTRPRRFGKTLNMKMLKHFFEIGSDKSLFDGLDISKDQELCDEYHGKFPVIFLSLKTIQGITFENALNKVSHLIQAEARRLQFLLNSNVLTDIDKQSFKIFFEEEISIDNQQKSLFIFSELLYKHYGKKVIILIDEYDVPLDKAYEGGYYDSMISHIRGIFQALKTNDFLHFAVLTGCLRISKESIFTGLNNLQVFTIDDRRFNEHFGFTETDVQNLLAYYNITDYYDIIKEWYNGYSFGGINIYNPWDVINYCTSIINDPNAEPKPYWANSSSNNLVQLFIDKANFSTKNDIEKLINNESIEIEVKQNLTYNEIDKSINNLWSVLYTTGYLTHKGNKVGKKYNLTIPNRGVQEIFISQIQEWFDENIIGKDLIKLKNFCNAFITGDSKIIEELLNFYLKSTISIRDTFTKKVKKENFYHGLLLGLLRSEEWILSSNTESGDGYSDIIIKSDNNIGCIIEVKYAENRSFDQSCNVALTQIERQNYTEKLISDNYTTIYTYGIACYKKQCKVVCKKIEV